METNRKIRDIWFGISTAWLNFKIFTFWNILITLGYIGYFSYHTKHIPVDYTYSIVFEIIIVILCWKSYFVNSTYIITEETFTFARSDVENSFFEIIIQAQVWGLLCYKTINLNEIDNIYIDSTSSKYYYLDIAGSFGSARLEFSSKQKRNEMRSALNTAVKKYNRNIDSNVNINY